MSRPSGVPPRFVHRPDVEGDGVVSFCGGCFLTVAKGATEEDLKDGERDHVCRGTAKKPPTSCELPAQDQPQANGKEKL